MSKQKVSNKIETMKQKRSLLQARIQKAESAQRTRQRKQDLQRKFLVGTYFWDQAEKEGKLAELKAQVLAILKRPADRALFEEA